MCCVFVLIFLYWQELVPCVLLSFDDEQILMWRGKDWKSMYPRTPPVLSPAEAGIAGNLDESGMCKEEILFEHLVFAYAVPIKRNRFEG